MNSTGAAGRTARRAGRRQIGDELAVRTYLDEMSELRAVDERLRAAAPGSAEYRAASSDLDRLSRRLMNEFRDSAGGTR